MDLLDDYPHAFRMALSATANPIAVERDPSSAAVHSSTATVQEPMDLPNYHHKNGHMSDSTKP